jgi:hypothetical protein
MSQAGQLKAYEDELKALAAKLADVGFMAQGSVVHRYTRCTAPGCRCNGDPPQPHGPYWQWSTAVAGKTITRRITEAQALLYKEWIANRRQALAILAEIEEVSRRAGEILLEGTGSKPDCATRPA